MKIPEPPPPRPDKRKIADDLKQGVVVGIKVDQGTVPAAGFPGEKISEGTEGVAYFWKVEQGDFTRRYTLPTRRCR